MADIPYVQQFAFTCPDCGLTTYLSNRPRKRRVVACGAHDVPSIPRGGCGVAHTITGLAPSA